MRSYTIRREPGSWGDSPSVANVTRCSMPLIRGEGSMPAIEIPRQDLSISQLRAEAARTADAKQARRILSPSKDGDCHGAGWAFAAVGRAGRWHGPADAARLGEASHSGWRSQLEWLAEGIRSNADGLAGLADRPRPGRQPRLAEAQRSEVAKWVEDGPEPKTQGGEARGRPPWRPHRRQILILPCMSAAPGKGGKKAKLL